MADYEYIKSLAYANIWCAPDQDRQYIFKPFRVSRKEGTANVQSIMGDVYQLPYKIQRMHVYTLASLPTKLLHLEDLQIATWTRVDNFCKIHNLIIDVYLGNGMHLPRTDSWIMLTENKVICMAITQNLAIDTNLSDGIKLDALINGDLYVRFYSNSFFNSTRKTVDGDIDVYGKLVVAPSDLLALNEFIATKSASPGKIYGYINGVCYPQIRAQDYVVGDYVELVYDNSIESIQTVSLLNAPDFESILDSKNKYLINPGLNSQQIRYFDDLDFYLGKSYPDGSWRGVYVHRNEVSNIRMVTHDTYSLSDELLSALRTGIQPSWDATLRNMQIKIVIRSSGFNRPLVSEHSRINEMYRLNGLLDQDIILKEPTISLNEWRLDNLENSYYPKLMSSLYHEVDNASVAKAYGYYPLSKLLGPSYLVPQSQQVTLPPALTMNSTVFEYNANGVLLGYYPHATGNVHPVQNGAATALVEVVTGVPGDTRLALGDQVLSHDYDYMLYQKNPNAWIDVKDSGVYQIVSGNVSDQLNWLTGDNFVIICDRYYPLIDNVVSSGTPLLVGTFSSLAEPLLAPLSDVDVWLNGHPLVEGIDFHVNWPVVGICTKSYWNPLGQTNRVIFRARGLQRGNSRKKPNQTGLIEYGLLSNNDKEDFHGDQNLQVIINGSLYNPLNVHYVTGNTVTYLTNTVFYAEDANLSTNTQTSGGNVVQLGINQNHALNGKPYSIKETYVSLKRFTRESTVDMRERSIDWDLRMRDWITENRTVPEPSVPNMVLAPYELYSPFIAMIIKALITEAFPANVYRKEFLDLNEVTAAISPWVIYRQFDPTSDHIWSELDHNVITIHAHPYTTAVVVDIYQARLLEFIAMNILDSRVDVSTFIQVTGTTASPTQW